ncbi:MAG: hypothetical protein ACYS30_06055 [Planctomycetota bacterium]
MKKLSYKIKDKVTGTIYHYTNNDCFKGIIKSKEIWMTNALFVNDKTELRASLEGDIFKDVEFKNPEFNVLKNKPQGSESKDIEDYYLASFSKDNNSLYQFRLYGNYCIGFDAKKLEKNRFNLFKCVYEKKAIKKWIIKKDKLVEWQNECFDNQEGQSYKGAAFFDVQFAGWAKLKNEYYKSEKEIRLLVVSDSSWGFYTHSPELFCDQPAIYFRNHKLLNVLVPYVKFFIPKKTKTREELEKMVKGKSRTETKQIIRNMEMEKEKDFLSINEVIIGPMQHQEEAVFAAKIFLLENGYDKVEVIPSDIPFRGN